MITLTFQPMQVRVRRTGTAQRASFSAAWPRVIDELERELLHLKATDIVVEGGFDSWQIRNDGWPKGGAKPRHHDIRLHFKSRHGPLSFECGFFDDYEANLRAIGLVMQDLRLMKARGVGTGHEQYRGWQQLPPRGGGSGSGNDQASQPQARPTPPPEWASVEDAMRFLCRVGNGSVLSVLVDDLDVVYRAAAKKAHPDKGGTNELMAKVTRARDFIEKTKGVHA